MPFQVIYEGKCIYLIILKIIKPVMHRLKEGVNMTIYE